MQLTKMLEAILPNHTNSIQPDSSGSMILVSLSYQALLGGGGTILISHTNRDFHFLI